MTHVNHTPLEKPQMIYGSTSISYPYDTRARKFIDFELFAQQLLDTRRVPQLPVDLYIDEDAAAPTQQSTGGSKSPSSGSNSNASSNAPLVKFAAFVHKWNGLHLTFFKYTDPSGRRYVSCRNRGQPILSPDVRYFVDLERLLRTAKSSTPTSDTSDTSDTSAAPASTAPSAVDTVIDLDALPDGLQLLREPEIQSVSCEMCGYLYPQIIKYPFPLALIPLHATFVDGRIRLPSTDTGVSAASIPPQALAASFTLVADVARHQLEVTQTVPGRSRVHLFPTPRSVELEQICSYLQRFDEGTNRTHVMRLYASWASDAASPPTDQQAPVATTCTDTTCSTTSTTSSSSNKPPSSAPRAQPSKSPFVGSSAAPNQCRYWYNHLLTEGWVLALLGDDGTTLVHREAMLKVKPQSARERHWAQFDLACQAHVIEATYKVYERGTERVTPDALRAELDMVALPFGLHRESSHDEVMRRALWDDYWQRFERQIMALATSLPNHRKPKNPAGPRVLVLCGLPGSGKSSFCAALFARQPNAWERVNQDEVRLRARSFALGTANLYRCAVPQMKTKQNCEKAFVAALKKGSNVVVDRCNFDFDQRSTWVSTAYSFPISRIDAVAIKTPPKLCGDRVVVRENHPTIKQVLTTILLSLDLSLSRMRSNTHEYRAKKAERLSISLRTRSCGRTSSKASIAWSRCLSVTKKSPSERWMPSVSRRSLNRRAAPAAPATDLALTHTMSLIHSQTLLAQF